MRELSDLPLAARRSTALTGFPADLVRASLHSEEHLNFAFHPLLSGLNVPPNPPPLGIETFRCQLREVADT
jgi:hypothetical protein